MLVSCRAAKETVKAIWNLDAGTQLQVSVLLWRRWSARNKVNAGERTASGPEICSLIAYHVKEFDKVKKQRARRE